MLLSQLIRCNELRRMKISRKIIYADISQIENVKLAKSQINVMK